MQDTTEYNFFCFESFEPNKPNAEANTSYIANLYRNVMGIMQSEFAPLYIEPVNISSVTLLPSRAGLNRKDHSINLDARKVTEDTRSLPIEKQRAQLYESGVVCSKRLVDAIVLFHELCHEMYETTNKPPLVREVKDSQDRMISEGFATFMDIYLMDVLCAKPELLRLTEQDRYALEQAKKYRIQQLKERRRELPHRTEGVLYIHNIFKKAKDAAEGDPQAGLHAVRSCLDTIDRTRALTTSRKIWSEDVADALAA